MKNLQNFENFKDFLPPGMKIEDFIIKNADNSDHLNFYSKKLKIFKPVEIKLLRNLSDILKDRESDYLEIEEIEDDDLEAGQICDMEATPAEIYINYCGKTYYEINEPQDFIENVDFVFV